jgi:hypothetical protein
VIDGKKLEERRPNGGAKKGKGAGGGKSAKGSATKTGKQSKKR